MLGAPGSPAAVDVGDLIIVTGVGNNSPGALMGGVYDIIHTVTYIHTYIHT